jgi:hypothetical protein
VGELVVEGGRRRRRKGKENEKAEEVKAPKPRDQTDRQEY